MKRYKEFQFLRVPFIIEGICVCMFLYGLIQDDSKWFIYIVFAVWIAVNGYTIFKSLSFFKKFISALEVDMELVGQGLNLNYRETFEDSCYSRLYSKLFRIQESKKVLMERQENEMQVIHQLISDISHQVKTPITTAKTYNQMLMKVPDGSYNKISREHLQIIQSQIDKLDFLMQALIKISRLETNIIELRPGNYDLGKILAEAYVGILHSAEKKKINVETNYKGSHYAFVDYKWTIEALFNIMDNAVKYTADGGRIEVRIEDCEHYKIVVIKDNGRGIEEDKIPLIFQRFYREEKSKEIEGLGLGLSLSKEIIEKEHGYIRVESILNEGTAFMAYLPKKEIEITSNDDF